MDEAEKRRKLLNADWSDGQDAGRDDVAISMVTASASSGISNSSSSNSSSSSASSSGRFEREEGDMMSALPGRRSFGGFNKAIERHYSEIMDEKRFNVASSSSAPGAISDQEMLDRYQNLVGLPRGPNQGMKPKSGGGGGQGGIGRRRCGW